MESRSLEMLVMTAWSVSEFQTDQEPIVLDRETNEWLLPQQISTLWGWEDFGDWYGLPVQKGVEETIKNHGQKCQHTAAYLLG